MAYIVALAVIAFVAMAVLKLVLSKAARHKAEEAYYLKESVFTPAERSFLGVLDSCMVDGCRVIAKVRLADIFGVKKGLGRGVWQSAFNQISAKHVDFLLVREADGAPVLGIELDDCSHNEPARKDRDGFVDGVFRSAGLPLLHISVRKTYSTSELCKQIEYALQ